MAKATPKPAASKALTVKKTGGTELTAKQNAALPTYLKGFKGPTGTEGIDSADITIPRIKLAQGLSDEVKSGDVKDGDLFLNITKETLAAAGQPLRFVVLARGKEFILWRPRKDNGGGILARARAVPGDNGVRYKWDKANQSFEVKVEGKTKVTWKTSEFIDQDGLDQWGSEIPGNEESGIAATAHHNYIVVLPDHDNMVAALSLSKSQVKKAKDFNALLKLGAGPLPARLYSVQTLDEKNSEGDFKNYKFGPVGYVDEAQYAQYAQMATAFAGINYSVDHSDGPEDEAEKSL